MLYHLNTICKRFTGIGISDDLPHIEKVKIRILNQCTWLAVFGGILIFLQSRYLDRGDYGIELINISLFAFPLAFHAVKNHVLARLTATVIFPVFILSLAITYGPKSSVEFIYFSSILIALIMYENKWIRILNIIGIILVFILNFYIWQNFEGLYPIQPSLFNDGVIFFCVTLAIASIIHNFFSEHKVNYQKQIEYNNTLADRNEKLEHFIEQNESKNQLIQIVAHDLKSPAASFLNLTQKLSYLIRTEQPKRLIDIAEHIEESGTHFFYTLDNLLNWVISQQDGIKVEKDHIELIPLIDELGKSMQASLYKKNIKITSLIPKNTFIYVDRNMLKIILNNLLHNAIKFSPSNEKVLITYQQSEQYDKIQIIDFGKGMDSETQQLIHQGESYFSKVGPINEKGHGMGLKICYRLATFLKGSIAVQSEAGKGCEVIVSIPRKLQPAESKASEVKRTIGRSEVGERVADV